MERIRRGEAALEANGTRIGGFAETERMLPLPPDMVGHEDSWTRNDPACLPRLPLTHRASAVGIATSEVTLTELRSRTSRNSAGGAAGGGSGSGSDGDRDDSPSCGSGLGELTTRTLSDAAAGREAAHTIDYAAAAAAAREELSRSGAPAAALAAALAVTSRPLSRPESLKELSVTVPQPRARSREIAAGSGKGLAVAPAAAPSATPPSTPSSAPMPLSAAARKAGKTPVFSPEALAAPEASASCATPDLSTACARMKPQSDAAAAAAAYLASDYAPSPLGQAPLGGSQVSRSGRLGSGSRDTNESRRSSNKSLFANLSHGGSGRIWATAAAAGRAIGRAVASVEEMSERMDDEKDEEAREHKPLTEVWGPQNKVTSVPIQQIVLVLLLTFDTVYTFSLCGSALQLVDESGVSDNQTNPDITSCATNGGAGCAASGVHAAVLVLIVSYAIFDILALYFILRRGFQQLALCIVIFMAVTVPSFVKPASGAQGSGDLLGDALVYHLLALALTLCGSLWLARQQLAVDSSVDALMGTVTVQGAMSARYSSMPTARSGVHGSKRGSTRAYDSSGRHNSPKPRRPSSGDRSDAASVKVDRWNPANNPFRRSDGGGAFRRSSLREETGRGGLGGSMRLVRPVQRRQNALQICVALFLLDLFGAALEVALAALPLIYPSLLTDAPDYYAPPLLDNDFPDDNAVALAATPPPVYLALVTLTFGLQPTAHGYDKTSRRRRRLARIFLSLLRFLPLLWAGCRLPLLLLLPRPYWLYVVQAVHWLSALSLVYVARRSLQGKLALRDIARALQVGQYYHVPEWLQEKLKDHDRAHVETLLMGVAATGSGFEVGMPIWRSLSRLLPRRLFGRQPTRRPTVSSQPLPAAVPPKVAAAVRMSNAGPSVRTSSSLASTNGGTVSGRSRRVHVHMTPDFALLRFTRTGRAAGLRNWSRQLQPLRIESIAKCEVLRSGISPGIAITWHASHMKMGRVELILDDRATAKSWVQALELMRKATATRLALSDAEAGWLLTLYEASCASVASGLLVPKELHQLLHRLNMHHQVFYSLYHQVPPPRLSYEKCCELYRHCNSHPSLRHLFDRTVKDAQKRMKPPGLHRRNSSLAKQIDAGALLLDEASFLRLMRQLRTTLEPLYGTEGLKLAADGASAAPEHFSLTYSTERSHSAVSASGGGHSGVVADQSAPASASNESSSMTKPGLLAALPSFLKMKNSHSNVGADTRDSDPIGSPQLAAAAAAAAAAGPGRRWGSSFNVASTGHRSSVQSQSPVRRPHPPARAARPRAAPPARSLSSLITPA